jgi:hypothetical protein
MDVAEILNQLTHAEGLPKAALQAASAQRIEILLVFVREIDSYLALDSADRAKPTPLFFIFHLLGEWRERTAYRPLAHLLRCPGHKVDVILGDAIASTTHRVTSESARRQTGRCRRRSSPIFAGGEVGRFHDPTRPYLHPEDVDIALDIDRYDFAVRVEFENGRPVARIETPAVTMPKSPT